MPPKEPTRAQLSSRLAYTQTTPAFLKRLQNKVAGTAEEDDDDEFEDDGSGRPPIPKRPAIPQRPDDDPGSADEDDADEAPQVVVIKEGKHLNHWQVENEKRKGKGLPPLPRPSSPSAESATTHTSPKTQSAEPGTDKPSSSSVSFGGPVKRTKRKAIGDADGDVDEAIAKPSSKKEGKKKQKKSKVGLSFADDAS